jgi:outer membrane protein TolC
VPICGAQQGVDLEQAIRYALDQNRNLRALELSVDSRALNVDSAKTEFLLTGRPSGSYSSGEDSDSMEYGYSAQKKTTFGTRAEVEGRMLDQSTEDGTDLRRGTMRVEIGQPLFRRFGRLVNMEPIRQAESGATAARRDYELQKTDLIVQVAETYENLLRLQRQVEMDGQNLGICCACSGRSRWTGRTSTGSVSCCA